MPIVTFHLVEDAYEQSAVGRLLVEASEFYIDTLYPGVSPRPIERARAFVTFARPQFWATAGKLVSDGGASAPFFTCLALAGRPADQLAQLLSGFTDLVERHLCCDRALIRGQVIEIDPAHWSIGGTVASTVRSGEAQLRAAGLNANAG